MSKLKVCRICLISQCKVYKFDRFGLKHYYEEVLAQKVCDKDGLPQFFCYECAMLLHKFHKFKEKCHTGMKVLKEISWKGKLTYEAIYKKDRSLLNLKSPLEILTVSQRVQTFITNDEIVVESETESLDNYHEPEISIDDVQNSVFVDESLGDIKPEQNIIDDDGKGVHLHVELLEDSDIKSDIKANNLLHEENTDEKVKKSDSASDVDDKASDSDEDDAPLFVDVKKSTFKLKNENTRVRRNNLLRRLKKDDTKKTRKRTKYLGKSKWKIYTLTEEEAEREFQKKAENTQYQAANYKCAECFIGFSQEDMLKRHKLLRHSDKLGPLECRFCFKRFNLDAKLRKHMTTHYTRYKCLQCDQVLSVENAARVHEDWHNGVIKKCSHCGEEFKLPSSYYTHLRTHKSEYICTLCGMSFVSAMGLNIHKKMKHIDNDVENSDKVEDMNTFCEKCDITFETRKAFEEHLFHSAKHTEGAFNYINDKTKSRKLLGKKTKARITQSLKIKEDADDDAVKPTRRRPMGPCHKKPTTCHQVQKYIYYLL